VRKLRISSVNISKCKSNLLQPSSDVNKHVNNMLYREGEF